MSVLDVFDLFTKVYYLPTVDAFDSTPQFHPNPSGDAYVYCPFFVTIRERYTSATSGVTDARYGTPKRKVKEAEKEGGR